MSAQTYQSRAGGIVRGVGVTESTPCPTDGGTTATCNYTMNNFGQQGPTPGEAQGQGPAPGEAPPNTSIWSIQFVLYKCFTVDA